MKLILPVFAALLCLLLFSGCNEPSPETVALAQLTMDLEAGTALSTEHVEVREVLPEEVPDGALRGVDVAYYLGRVLAEDREAGVLLDRDHFARPEPPPVPEHPAPPAPRQIDHEWCEEQKEEILAAIGDLDRSCQLHADCVLYRPSCPFGCGESVHRNAPRGELQRSIRSFRGECELCRTDCDPPGYPVCEDGQCTFGEDNLRAAEARAEEEEMMRLMQEQIGATNDPAMQELLQQIMGGNPPW